MTVTHHSLNSPPESGEKPEKMETIMKNQQFQSLDNASATAFLREAHIDRQQQSLSSQQVEDVRLGKQDQSLGFDDAIYGLTNADRIWPQVETQMGKQSA